MRSGGIGRALAGALVLLLVGAGAAGCRGGRSFVRVTVDGDEAMQIDALDVLVTNAGRTALPVTVPVGASSVMDRPHVVFALEFAPDRSGPLTIDVIARLVPSGTRSGRGEGEIRPGETTDVAVRLGAVARPDGGTDGSTDGGFDAGPPPPSCINGVRDQDETDTDCGGAICAPCGLGARCMTATDCRSRTCANPGTCRGWEPTGPWGATTIALAARPDRPATAFAGTLGAIFRTTDGGGEWTRLTTGLDADEPAVSLAINPRTPDEIYARTFSRVIRSTDGGNTWAELGGPWGDLGFDYPPITALAVAPTTPPVLLVGAETGLHTLPLNGTATKPITGHRITALAVDPANPSIIYAGTQDAGIYRSTSAGQAWTPITMNNTPVGRAIISAIAVAPSGKPAWVYAATTEGLYKWDPAAPNQPWARELQDLVGGAVSHVAFDPKLPDTIYAAAREEGAFRRTRGAWGEWRDGLRDPSDVLQLVPAGDTVFAATPIGVYRAPATGNTWQAASHGMDAFHVDTVAVDPLQPDTVYAGVAPWFFAGLMFKSTDGGQAWTPIPAVSDPSVITPALAGGKVILHAGVWSGVRYNACYSNSGDGGKTWSQPVFPNGMNGGYATALVVHPAAAAHLFYAVGTGNGDSAGVFESTDTGATWKPIVQGLPRPPNMTNTYCEPNALIFDRANNLYASGCGIWRLPPGGVAWQPASGTGQTAVSPSTAALALAADGALFTGGDGGLFVTRNPAAPTPTWTWLGAAPGPAPNLYAIATHPTDAQTLWIGTPTLIARSTSGGAPRSFGTQKVTSRWVAGFAFRPGTPDTIYAATDGAGVLKTITGGE